MEPATKIAIAALIISFFSVILTFINSVYTAKTYKKNTRLEFFQRRDYLSQKISELNDRNTEAQLISARLELVAVKRAGLALQGEQAERNTAMIAFIYEQREGVEDAIKRWDENTEKLRSLYSKFTSRTYASFVEEMIDIVQVASDILKKAINSYSAALHVLETTSEITKKTLAETDEKIRQINLDFERAIEKLTK